METDFQKTWKSDFNSKDFFKNVKKALTEAVGEPRGDMTSGRVDEAVSKPYATLASLPDAVKKLPKHAQEIFLSAFNAAYRGAPEGRDKEEYAFKVAWSAVGKAGYGAPSEKSISLLQKTAEILKSSAEGLSYITKQWITLPDGRHIMIGDAEHQAAFRAAKIGVGKQSGGKVNLKTPNKVEIKVGDETHTVSRNDVKSFFDSKEPNPTSIGSFKGSPTGAWTVADNAKWALGTYDAAVRMIVPSAKSIAKIGVEGAGPIPKSGLAGQALADYKPSKKWGREAGIKFIKQVLELLKGSAKILKDFGGHYDTYENGHYGGADSATKETSSTTTETKKEIQKSFNFLIEKAFPVDVEGNRIEVSFKNFQKDAPEGEVDLKNMYLEGIATTANVDHDEEKMSGEAMDAMLEDINKKGVPLMNEHQKTWDAKLGDVFKAWKDERNQLHIKAKLDKDNSRAIDLYKAIKKGLQVGLSVAGIVKRSAMEFVESLGKKVKTFYDVALKEISVTNRPSNFDTWLIAKHQAGSLEGHLFEKPHPFYEEYLQNYPSLNWQFEIAKSVTEFSKEVMPEAEIKVEEKKTTEKSDEDTFKSDVVGTMTKMADSFNSLAKQIEDLLKQVRETDEETSVAGERTETSTTETKADEEGKNDKKEDKKKEEGKTDNEESTTNDKVTKPCKAEAKKEDTTIPPEKKPAETTTETKTTDEDKKDEEEKSAEDIKVSKRIAAEIITEAIQKRMKEQGRRIMGPLQETIEKMLGMSVGRKGIASERAYMIEKGFAGNPQGEQPPEGGKGGGEDEEFQKDLKDEKMTFKDVFKKHFSSYKE